MMPQTPPTVPPQLPTPQAAPPTVPPSPVSPVMMPQMQPPHRRGISVGVILVIFLGLGTVLFGLLSIVAFSESSKATTTLNSAKAQAYAAGQTAQKKTDSAATLAASESPYRSYVAPDFAGNFEINFPKNWSSSIQENESSSNQVVLYAQPNFIKTTTNTTPDNLALEVELTRSSSTSVQQQYDVRVKAGKLKVKTITVSGISAQLYTGKLDEQTTGQLAVVGVRDKSIIFATHNDQYDNEFAQVLAQARINP